MERIDRLACPVCDGEELTFTHVVPAHRERSSAMEGSGDAPPPHDVPRTAFFVCERCDSPNQVIVPENWQPNATA